MIPQMQPLKSVFNFCGTHQHWLVIHQPIRLQNTNGISDMGNNAKILSKKLKHIPTVLTVKTGTTKISGLLEVNNL